MSAIDLYLSESGRALVLFDGKKFSAVWMPEWQFRREAASLGVNMPLLFACVFAFGVALAARAQDRGHGRTRHLDPHVLGQLDDDRQQAE